MAEDASTSSEFMFTHYRVLENENGGPMELGRGAMGITYKAIDTNLLCEVALKVINPQQLGSEETRKRFLREARTAATLRHHNVATVFHLGFSDEDENYFYAMEFVEGDTVDDVVRRDGSVPPLEALRIISQVASALAAAEKKQLIHRDIKPSNIMLKEEADGESVVKLIDFGLAKSFSNEGERSVWVSTGGFMGTPLFASPEQILEEELDIRSDIYSLGITLWYMIEGKPPFSGSLAKVMDQHRNVSPPFERLQPVPEPVKTLLAHMLEKDRDKRPETASALKKEVNQCIEALKGGATASADSTVTETLVESAPPADSLAGRYMLSGKIGDTPTSSVYRAYDLQTRQDVVLRFIPDEILSRNPASLEALRTAVDKASSHNHQNLVKTYPLVDDSIEGTDGVLVVTEWIHGFALLDLLKARTRLELPDILPFLRQSASAVDFCTEQQLSSPDLDLSDIQLHFPQTADTTSLLSDTGIQEWPVYRVKISPFYLDGILQISEEDYQGEVTIASTGSMARLFLADASPVSRLGVTAYTLLGGELSPSDAIRRSYTPLAELSEQGNEALHQCIFPDTSRVPFPSAEEFVRALEIPGVWHSRAPSPSLAPQHQSAPAAPLPGASVSPGPVAHSIPAHAAPQHAQAPAAYAPVAATSPRPPTTYPGAETSAGRRGLSASSVALIVILLLGGGGGALFFLKPELFGVKDGQGNVAGVPGSGGSTTIIDNGGSSGSTNGGKPPDNGNGNGGTTTIIENGGEAPKPPAPPDPPKPPTPAELLSSALAGKNSNDPVAAMQLFAELSTKHPESPEAATVLGHMTEIADELQKRGDSIPQTDLEAMSSGLMHVARTGHVGAMLMLAHSKYDEAPAESFIWFKKAAQKYEEDDRWRKAIEVLVLIKDLYSSGPPASFAGEQFDILLHGLKQNQKWRETVDQEAIDLLKKAADKGFISAMCQIGLFYSGGIGVEPDVSYAFEWFKKASDAGDPMGQYYLGECYLWGKGIEKDQKRAAELLQKSADQDNARAMEKLGTCYHKGWGVKQDSRKAHDYYKKAAALGFADALANLGVLYINGDYVVQNPLKAVQYFKEAAESDSALGMRFYAMALEKGIGTSVDTDAAKTYYKQAAEGGDKVAIDYCTTNKISFDAPSRFNP